MFDVVCEGLSVAAQRGQGLLKDAFYLTGYLPQKDNISVEGYVAPGFEPVRELFRENFRLGLEKNAQLCVYVGEEKVVDLWGTTEKSPEQTFGPDSLINAFSCTKTMTAIALASLMDKHPESGLKYSTNITEIWPEFGQKGKKIGTVRDLMRHELGLPELDEPIKPEYLLVENIKKNKVGEVIERQTYKDLPGTRRDYHIYTRGWIINEVFRRADPKGRTVGEYLRQEITDKIGAKAYIGLTAKECDQAVDLSVISPIFVTLQGLLPPEVRSGPGEVIVRASQTLLAPLLVLARKLFAVMTDDAETTLSGPEALTGVPLFRLDRLTKYLNSDTARQAESPSVNGHCTARGMAMMAAAMANGGSFKGKEVLSPRGWAEMHAMPKKGFMFGTLPTSFTQGGVNMYTDPPSIIPEDLCLQGREGFVGWMGFGGSVLQWHPNHKVGFGYLPSQLDWTDLNNCKGMKLQKCVINCITQRSEFVVI